jgi:hypothetical protein
MDGYLFQSSKFYFNSAYEFLIQCLIRTGEGIQTKTTVRSKSAAKGNDPADLKNNGGLMEKA